MIRKAFAKIGYFALKIGMRLPEIGPITRFSEQGHIIDLLDELKINYVLDVGAHDGTFAKHLRMGGYEGNILCFEPITVNCDSIKRLASGDPTWQIFNFALGDEYGIKPFNICSDRTVLSSFLHFSDEKDPSTRIESITIRRMDNVLDELIPDTGMARIFLKIDTQGYDVEVLRGCGRWIEKCLALQSEVSVCPVYRDMPHYTEALAYYESLGFSLLDLYVVWRNRQRSVSEYDCIMARLDQFGLS
jgi:FkbM family methyltransferase